MTRRRRRERQPRSAHFQVGNCAGLPFEPKLTLRLTRRPQAPRPPGDPRRAHGRSPVEANARSVSVTLPNGRAPRQRPHPHDLHQGRSSPPRPARPARSSAARRRSRPSSTSRSKAPSTCAPPPTNSPTSPSISRASSTSSWPERSTASTAACAPPSRRFRTFPSPNSCSTSSGARRPADQQQSDLRPGPESPRQDDRPERRSDEHQDKAARQLRLPGDPPAASPGGARGRSPTRPRPPIQNGGLGDARRDDKDEVPAVRPASAIRGSRRIARPSSRSESHRPGGTHFDSRSSGPERKGRSASISTRTAISGSSMGASSSTSTTPIRRRPCSPKSAPSRPSASSCATPPVRSTSRRTTSSSRRRTAARWRSSGTANCSPSGPASTGCRPVFREASTSRSTTRAPSRGAASICRSPRPRTTSRSSTPSSARSSSRDRQPTSMATGSTARPVGPFGEVGHIAVDDDGNIYVIDVNAKVVNEFDSTGDLPAHLPRSGSDQRSQPGNGRGRRRSHQRRRAHHGRVAAPRRSRNTTPSGTCSPASRKTPPGTPCPRSASPPSTPTDTRTSGARRRARSTSSRRRHRFLR